MSYIFVLPQPNANPVRLVVPAALLSSGPQQPVNIVGLLQIQNPQQLTEQHPSTASQWSSSDSLPVEEAEDDFMEDNSCADVDDSIDREKQLKLVQKAKEEAFKGLISIDTFCSYLIRYNAQNGHVACKICGELLRVQMPFCGKQSLCNIIIDHATKHSHQLPFSCQLCAFKSSTQIQLRNHLIKEHDKPISSQNISTINVSRHNFIEILTHCFGQNQERACSEDDLTVTEYCRRLITRIINRNCDSIRCSFCGIMIRVIVGGSIRVCQAVQHVLGHLQRRIYACRLCYYHASTRSAIRSHTHRKHGRSFAKDTFDDKMEIYSHEIRAIIDHCYDNEAEDNGKMHNLAENSWKRLERTKATAVLNFCRELSLKFGNGDKLTCQLCGTEVRVRATTQQFLTRSAIIHAKSHMEKRHSLYGSTESRQQPAWAQCMIGAGAKKYQLFSEDQWQRSCALQGDLLRMLAKCYDKDQGAKGVSCFGLEESDRETESDEDELCVESSKGNAARNGLHMSKCALRSTARRTGRKGRMVLTVDEDYTKLPDKRENVVKINYISNNAIIYKCKYCSMTSKHKVLVQRHLNVLHRDW